jgi:hypothetical protein
MKLSVSKTYSLSQEDVLAVVAEFLSDKTGNDVKASDLTLSIKDSSMADPYYDNGSKARITAISYTTEE